MSKKRSMIAGMTDYSGYTLEEMIKHIYDWEVETTKVVNSLSGLKIEVQKEPDEYEDAESVVEYIDHMIYIFNNYKEDFVRLLKELPSGVEQRHVQIVDNIYRYSQLEERSASIFKKDFIECRLKNESRRRILDQIYQDSESMLVDYRDLSNLKTRLLTFVGTKSYKKIKSNLWLSVIGLTMSIMVALISITNLFNNVKTPDIKRKIQELDEIKKSLSILDSYTTSQKKNLEDIAKEFDGLQRKKKTLENIISLDSVKVETYLQYQAEQNKSSIWLELSLAFIVGIFSSLSATGLRSLYKRKKQLRLNDHKT